jgi:site-specific DNA-adenine methylase
MIKNLWRLHLGLIKYLMQELKKKRNFTQFIHLFIDITKIYYRELLKVYRAQLKNLDPDYQKQKKQYEKYTQLKKDLQRALRLLNYLDSKMAKMGMNRQSRRQFWRDFYRDGQIRKEVFNNLLEEIKQYENL